MRDFSGLLISIYLRVKILKHCPIEYEQQVDQSLFRETEKIQNQIPALTKNQH